MARDLKEEKDQTIEDLNAQIAELKAQIADMAGTVKTHGENIAQGLRAKGEHVADEVRHRARRAYSAASDQADIVKSRAQGYLQEADTAVKENPATAMGVAVGVGFLMGVLLSRR